MNSIKKWEVVEHNWSDTSIYDENGAVVCSKSIDDEATEENQEELEIKVSENFKLMVNSPEMMDLLSGLVSDVSNLLADNPEIEWQEAGYYNAAKEFLKNFENE